MEYLEKELAVMVHPYPNLEPHMMKYLHQYASDPAFREYVDTWISMNDEYETSKLQLQNLTSSDVFHRQDKLEFQSGETGVQKTGDINSATVVTHDTLTEIGGEETKEITNDLSTITYIKTDNSLNDFFLRPVQIGSFAMAVGGTYTNVYSVADLYLSDQAVRAKLRNFAFLRGTFVVRISVSGTPFDSGRIMASAYPWSQDNAVLSQLFAVGSTWNNLQLQYMSQAKTSTVIDLKENKPVDIELPWVSPAPVGRLFNQSTVALGSATSFSDFTDLWKLYLKTLNPMKSVAASPSPVFVYVYAYMKDVQIGVPTGSQIALTLNSGSRSRDERKTGPVENIASNLLSISTLLEKAPVIGIYAKASSMVFGGLKSVAALFGWSAPVLTTVPNRVKNEPFQNGAAMIQNDTGLRMTLDPKQELAVSTEYASVYKDELVIADLCMTPSFLTTFTWPAATSPMSNMYNIAIHPRMASPFVGTPSGTVNVVPTPMNFVSQLFTKWHGKIVITLEVVCTAFHRGKLLITYDPNIWHYGVIVANTNLNKQYTHVWDIQETQRYSICVDWNFHRPWANNLSDVYSLNLLGTTLSPSSELARAVNGFLSIAPMTKLQSPDGSDISINIYVHGEEMRFNRMSDKYMPYDRALTWNSGAREVTNVDETCIPITRSTVAEQGLEHHFFGEQPLSLRSLLKRFVTVNSIDTAVATPWATNYDFNYETPIYSSSWGRPGINAGSSKNFATVLGHIRYAFLAMRGSVRKRFTFITDSDILNSPVYVSMMEEASTSGPTLNAVPPQVGMVIDGSNVFIPSTNAGIEIEMPFYSNNYFVFSSLVVTDSPNCPQFDNTGNSMMLSVVSPVNKGGSRFTVQEAFATGEDFQLSYFMGTVPYVSH